MYRGYAARQYVHRLVVEKYTRQMAVVTQKRKAMQAKILGAKLARGQALWRGYRERHISRVWLDYVDARDADRVAAEMDSMHDAEMYRQATNQRNASMQQDHWRI